MPAILGKCAVNILKKNVDVLKACNKNLQSFRTTRDFVEFALAKLPKKIYFGLRKHALLGSQLLYRVHVSLQMCDGFTLLTHSSKDKLRALVKRWGEAQSSGRKLGSGKIVSKNLATPAQPNIRPGQPTGNVGPSASQQRPVLPPAQGHSDPPKAMTGSNSGQVRPARPLSQPPLPPIATHLRPPPVTSLVPLYSGPGGTIPIFANMQCVYYIAALLGKLNTNERFLASGYAPCFELRLVEARKRIAENFQYLQNWHRCAVALTDEETAEYTRALHLCASDEVYLKNLDGKIQGDDKCGGTTELMLYALTLDIQVVVVNGAMLTAKSSGSVDENAFQYLSIVNEEDRKFDAPIPDTQHCPLKSRMVCVIFEPNQEDLEGKIGHYTIACTRNTDGTFKVVFNMRSEWENAKKHITDFIKNKD